MTDRTFRNWMKQGREDQEGGGEVSWYSRFYDTVKSAEAAHAIALAGVWSVRAKSDWRAAKAYLGSRYPDDWGRDRKTGKGRMNPSPPVVINVTLTNGMSLADAIPPQYLPIVNMAVEPDAPPQGVDRGIASLIASLTPP